MLELKKRNGELADLSRAEVIAHLCKIIEAEGKEKTADRLKAVEMLRKMTGLNEPEKVERTERIELLVDAQVLHALHEGYKILHPVKASVKALANTEPLKLQAE